MRSNGWMGFGAVAGLGLGLLALGNPKSNGQAPEVKPGVVWEYRTIFEHTGHSRQNNDELLNRAGQEGWELVAVGEGSLGQVRCTFKRPKPK